MTSPERTVWLGLGLGDWSGVAMSATDDILRRVTDADRDGLDVFAVGDHPYSANA